MFLFVMYLARTLGGTEYGKYEFATSIGYLIGIFFELGGNMILTKHTARNFYSSIYYAVKIRIASIVISLAIFYLILFATGIYEEIRLYIFYSAIGLAFSSMMNLYFAFFRGAGKMGYEAIVLIIQKSVFIVLALILLYYSNTGSNVLLGFMLSMVAGFLIIFVIFKRKEPYYSSISDNKEDIRFKDYMIDVLTLALVEIFGTVYFRLTQLFLEHYRGFEEVSTYGIAYRIVEVFTGFPAILLLALFPAFAKLASENILEFRLQFNKIVLLLYAAGFLSAIVCWFGGEYIFELLGKDYSRSYIVLRYLGFPLLFLFPNYIITQGLIALNKNMVFAKILIAALLLNVVLSYLLVPQMGAAGSAISVGICEMMIFISGYYYIRKFTADAV